MYHMSFGHGMKLVTEQCVCSGESDQVCKTCLNELVQRVLWLGTTLPEAGKMIDMELWAVEVWR